MLFLVLFILFLLFMAGCAWSAARHPSKPNEEVTGAEVGTGIGFIGACVFLVVMIGFFIAGYNTIINKDASIRQTIRTERVLEDRAKDVGDTLENYLTGRYPQYEQETIEKFVAQGPQLILLQFPELETADTFVEYTRTYKELKDDVYAQATKRNELEADLDRVNNNDLLYLTFLLP